MTYNWPATKHQLDVDFDTFQGDKPITLYAQFLVAAASREDAAVTAQIHMRYFLDAMEIPWRGE